MRTATYRGNVLIVLYASTKLSFQILWFPCMKQGVRCTYQFRVHMVSKTLDRTASCNTESHLVQQNMLLHTLFRC